VDEYLCRIGDAFVRDDAHEAEVFGEHPPTHFPCPDCDRLAVLAQLGFHICLICHSCWEVWAIRLTAKGLKYHCVRRARFHPDGTPDTRVTTAPREPSKIIPWRLPTDLDTMSTSPFVAEEDDDRG